MADPLLSCEDLSHRYEPDADWVVDGINFTMAPAETVAFLGTSGVGKTTLLEILGTMREPARGKVYLDGQDVYAHDVQGRSELRGQYLGFVFQESLLLPDLSVWENCRLAVTLSQRDWSQDRIRDRYERLLKAVDMDPSRGEEGPGNFSTGERQRLALVRSIMHQPDLLLADEPTGNLDARTSEELIQLLGELSDEDGLSVLVATHDHNLADAMERRLYMAEKQLQANDPET